MNWLKHLILWKLSLIYRFAIFIWDIYWRVANKTKLGCRVISVGNIIVGGTGKTPIVKYIAELATGLGFKTAVVARGYKRKSRELIEVDSNSTWQSVGDEPLEIFRLTDNVRVYVHQHKTTAAHKACSDGAEIIIVDDGFQHRKLHRDIDLVCLDYDKPYGPGGMLPLGLLREPRKNLKRADILCLTSYDKYKASLVDIEIDKPTFYVKSSIANFLNLKTNQRKQPDEFHDLKPIAFCGLANPVKFENNLRLADVNIIKLIPFPDHHAYTAEDIRHLVEEAQKSDANCLITTYKDAVKIESFDFSNFDIYSAMLEISIVDQEGNICQESFKKALGF